MHLYSWIALRERDTWLVAQIFCAYSRGFTLAGRDWNSHIRRSTHDDVLSEWSLTSSTLGRKIGGLKMAGGCFHVSSDLRERGTWWNPARHRWHDNDNCTCNVAPERNRWRTGCTLQVRDLDLGFGQYLNTEHSMGGHTIS